MSSNKVQVDVEVGGVPQGESAFKRTAQSAKDAAREISAAGGSFDELFVSAKRGSADAAAELENLVEKSTLTGRAAKEAAAAYREETRDLTRLGRELRETAAEASKLQRELAAGGNAPGSRAAAELARGASRSAAALDADPANLGRASAFQRGTAQRELQALREEAKGVARETGKANQSLLSLAGGGQVFKQVIGGLIGGNLITAAVQGVIELAVQYRELQRADAAARRQLIQSSVDAGVNIRQQIEAVNALKETYRGLSEAVLAATQAEALRASRTPVTQQTILENAAQTAAQRERLASLRVPPQALSRAAQDVATIRDLRDQEALDKTSGFNLSRVSEARAAAGRKGLADLEAGNPQPLLGLSDAEVQARYAGVFNKLPSDFTEDERRTARRVELLRQASGAYVTAEEAVRRYRESLKDLQEGESTPQQDARAAEDAQTTAEIARLDRVRKGQEQFKKTRDDFWKSVAENDAKRAAEEAKAEADRQAALKGARDGALSLLKEVGQFKGKDNPFVSLFTEAADAARNFEETSARLRRQFGEDADALIEKLGEMTEAKRAALAESAAGQRFEDQLTALTLRQEAASIRDAKGPAAVAAQEAKAQAVPRAAAVLVAPPPAASFAFFGPDSPFASRSGATGYRDSYFNPDSPFAPRTAEQAAALASRAEFLRSKDSGRLVADFAAAYADTGGGAQAEGAQASRSADNAREVAGMIRRLEAQAVAEGLDATTAHRVANEQILRRVKGSVSAEDLAGNADLRGLVADALDFKAGGLESREQEARAMREAEAEAASRRELTDALQALTGAVRQGFVTVEVKSADVKADVLGRAW